MSKCNRLSVSSFQNYVLKVEVKTLQRLWCGSQYMQRNSYDNYKQRRFGIVKGSKGFILHLTSKTCIL